MTKQVNKVIEANTFQGWFDLYKSEEFRSKQKREQPFFWRGAYNWFLKAWPIDWWRRDRAIGTVWDMVPVLKKIQSANRVVDLACGQEEITDEVVNFLHERFPYIRAIGIDNATDVSARILRKPHIAFCRGDATRTDLPDGSVDVVLAFYFLQALDESGRDRLFEEIRRLLAPDGTVIFLEVLKKNIEEEDEKNKKKHIALNANAPYFVLSDEGWVRYIEGHGYQVDASILVMDRSKAYKAHPV